MFEHTVNVTAINRSGNQVIQFEYSGDMRKLKNIVAKKMSDWKDIWYSKIEDPNGEGHIWR